MSAKKREQLTLRLNGFDSEDGDVWLHVLASKLTHLVKALKEYDDYLTGGEGTNGFLVTDLKHNCAEVSIAERPLKENTFNTGTISKFGNELVHIKGHASSKPEWLGVRPLEQPLRLDWSVKLDPGEAAVI